MGKEAELCHYCKNSQKRFCKMCSFLKVCQSHPKSCFLFFCRIVIELWKFAISIFLFISNFFPSKYLYSQSIYSSRFSRCSLIYGVLFLSGSGSQLVSCSSCNILEQGEPAGNKKNLSEKKVIYYQVKYCSFFFSQIISV